MPDNTARKRFVASKKATGRTPRKDPHPLKDPLWERQKNESSPAFEAFTVYRDLGTGRSVVRAARQLRKSERTLQVWSRLWSWPRRAAAWEDSIDQESQAVAASARVQLVERAHEAIDQLQRMGRLLTINTYNVLVSTFRQNEDGSLGSTLSHSELIRLLEVSTTLWRRATGIPDRLEATLIDGTDGQDARRWRALDELLADDKAMDQVMDLTRRLSTMLPGKGEDDASR